MCGILPVLIDHLEHHFSEVISSSIPQLIVGSAIQRFRLAMTPGIKEPIPQEVVAEYATGSIIGLITWWLENDMPFLRKSFLIRPCCLRRIDPIGAPGSKCRRNRRTGNQSAGFLGSRISKVKQPLGFAKVYFLRVGSIVG